jgi:hypothetical protein
VDIAGPLRDRRELNREAAVASIVGEMVSKRGDSMKKPALVSEGVTAAREL